MASYLLINRAPNSLKASTASFNTAISLLVFTAVVFRAEILLLLGPFALQSLAQNHTTLRNLVKIGLISGVFSLGEIFFISVDYNCHSTSSSHDNFSRFIFLE